MALRAKKPLNGSLNMFVNKSETFYYYYCYYYYDDDDDDDDDDYYYYYYYYYHLIMAVCSCHITSAF